MKPHPVILPSIHPSLSLASTVLSAAALRGQSYAHALRKMGRERMLLALAATLGFSLPHSGEAFTGQFNSSAPTTDVLLQQLTGGGATEGTRNFSDNGGPPGQTFTLSGGTYTMTDFSLQGINNFGNGSLAGNWGIQIGTVDLATGAITQLAVESGNFAGAGGSDFLTFHLDNALSLNGNVRYAVSVFSTDGWYGFAHSTGDVYSGGTAFNNGTNARTFTNNNVVNAVPGNYDYVFSLQGTQLTSIAGRIWSGTNGGTWDNSAVNFTGSAFTNGDDAFFNDLDGAATPPLTRTITVGAGGVTASSIFVDNSAGDYSFTGAISATAGLTKTGTSAATLAGTTDNATLTAAVSGGTLILAKDSSATVHAITGAAIGATGTLRLAGTGGDQISNTGGVGVNGTLDLNGRSEAIDALTGGSTGVITNTNATAAMLTVGQNNSSGTYGGSFNNGLGTVGLVKTGNGVLTLTRASNYTGGTTINGGTLALGGDSAGTQVATSLGSGPVSVTGGGILRLGGFTGAIVTVTTGNNITLDNGTIFANDGLQRLSGTLTVNGAGGTLTARYFNKDLSVDGAILGAGPLSITQFAGAGGKVIFAGANPGYSGATTVTAGGVLQSSVAGALGSGSVTVDGTLNLNSVNQSISNLAGGTGVINAGASTVTIGGGSFDGVINGTAASLTGALTLSGAASLNTGTVRLGTGSNLNVAGVAGAPFGNTTNVNGTGTITGALTTVAGNALSPGANNNGVSGSIGTLNTGDLTIATGTTLNFVLGAPGVSPATGSGSLINVVGNLTLNDGTPVQFIDNANAGGLGTFANGLYKLIAYSGTITGFNAATTFTPVLPLSHNYSFINTAGQIQVAVSTAGLTWTGKANGNGADSSVWNTTGSNLNWANISTAAAYTDAPAFIVTFQDTNAVNNVTGVNPNVQVQAGGVNPISVFFTNNSTTFTLSSADAVGIAGSGALVKGGSGTTILNGANTYTGSTAVNTGTLRLGHASAVQNSTVSLNSTLSFAPGVSPFTLGGLESSGALDLRDTAAAPITVRVGNNGATTAYSGVLSGTGALTKIGNGLLTLTGDSSFTGNVVIEGGSLVANLIKNVANSTTGALGNPTTVNRTITVQSGATLNFASSNVLGSVGSSAPALGLIINAGGTVTNSNNAYNLLGAVTLNGGTLSATGGESPNYPAYQLRGNVTTGLAGMSSILGTGGNSAIQLQGGVGNGIIFDVADSPDADDLLVSAALEDGYAPGASATKSASSLNKNGLGTMHLTSGGNSYTGGTNINGGKLTTDSVLPGGTTANPTTVNIAAGATLEYANNGDIFQSPTNFTGAGTILKTGAGTLFFDNGNYSMALSTGALIDVQAGRFKTGNWGSNDNNYSANHASLNIASGAIFDMYSNTVVFDKLTGDGILEGGYFNSARTLTLGIDNGTSTFSGTIRGNGVDPFSFTPLIKTGNGSLTLNGTLNFTGSYNADTLVVRGGIVGSPSTLVLSPLPGSLVGFVNTTANNNTGTGGGSVLFGPNQGDNVLVTQTSGTLWGQTVSVGRAGVATFNVSGGIVNTRNLELAYTGPFDGTGAVALNVSGTAAVNVWDNGPLTMGHFFGRPVSVTQTGGEVILYSNAGTTRGGNGSLAFESANTAATYNLDGGLLSIPRVTYATDTGNGFGGGNGIINFNGGTLQITAGGSAIPTGTAGGQPVVATRIKEGGALIDTAGNNVTIASVLEHGGVAAVDGGLTVNDSTGLGRLIVTAPVTYTGATNVTAGTLEFTTSQTLSSLNIGAGASVVLSASNNPFASFGGNAGSAVVPEPGSLGLLMLGTLGILGRRRRPQG